MVRLSAYLNLLFDDESFADRVDQVAEVGFGGFEVYGWDRDLEAIAGKRDEHDLEWVYMSGDRPDMTDPDVSEAAIENLLDTIKIAEDVGCRNLNVKSGATQAALDRESQRENVVEVLRAVTPAAEEAGVTLLLEPINSRELPDHFTHTASEGASIVSDVDSPRVKLLYDFYHEQVMKGDVIRSFQEHVHQIGHVHIADNPGRHEPNTGEMNYRNILAEIEASEYEGYVGCEFYPTNDPIEILEDIGSFV